MKIVFISNFFTPHQAELCNYLYKVPGNEFLFIETFDVINKEIPIGWCASEKPQYVICYKDFIENKKHYLKIICESDVVIFGSAPVELVKSRLKENKLTFRYSERIYKKKCPWYEFPARAIKYFFENQRHKSLYLLCASAYTAGDYAKTGTFKNRTYKWGYFPQTKEYDIDKLLTRKTDNSILWVGRLIGWKHPEIPLEIAKRLKSDGYKFNLEIIGTGDMDDEIKGLIEKENLHDRVHVLGSMPPEDVRIHMEKSRIFMFTSDRQEGWGAVLNEAMNSGCSAVASSSIGSAPYLVENGKNGFLYKDGDLDDLYAKVKHLLCNTAVCNELGKAAYRTINEVWNGEVAAERFIDLSNALLSKKHSTDMFTDGPCSKAQILKDNWYK